MYIRTRYDRGRGFRRLNWWQWIAVGLAVALLVVDRLVPDEDGPNHWWLLPLVPAVLYGLFLLFDLRIYRGAPPDRSDS